MNKVLTQKPRYIQHGGVTELVGIIGSFIAAVVVNVFYGIKEGVKSTMRFWWKDAEGEYIYNPLNWSYGFLWQYLWWCIKSSFYLLIFCFGGPLIILFGIILLYKNLGEKLTQRADYEEEKKNNNAGVNTKNNAGTN